MLAQKVLLLRMWLLIIHLTSLYLRKRVLQYSLDLRLQRDRLPRNIEPARDPHWLKLWDCNKPPRCQNSVDAQAEE